MSNGEKSAIDFSLAGVSFNTQQPVDRLLQFIRAEKPHFRPDIEPGHLQTAIVVKPKLNNRRILAQSGAFLLVGLNVDLESAPPIGVTIERISINGSKKQIICDELDRMAINDSSMFPEIEKAAIYIKSKL